MLAGSLARRYARALMQIGAEQKNAEKLGADVRNLAKAMDVSAELTQTLTNPAFPRADRKKILDALGARFGIHATSKTFLYVLLDKERLSHLPAISREVDAAIEAKAGRVVAEVVSATPLTPAQVTQVTEKLEQLSGKKIQLTRREDPSLLGGIVAKVGDVTYDGSVRTQLRAVRDQMQK